MFHSKMEMLLWSFFPTNSTRSRYILTCGTTPSEAITDSHTWWDQQAVSHPKRLITSDQNSERVNLSNSRFSPSAWCRCHWIASWSRGSWCRCSWSRCKATLLCCHSLLPGRESFQQTSRGPEWATCLRRKNRLKTQESASQWIQSQSALKKNCFGKSVYLFTCQELHKKIHTVWLACHKLWKQLSWFSPRVTKSTYQFTHFILFNLYE